MTAETLRLHRGLAVERHRRELLALARRLSVSDRRCPPRAGAGRVAAVAPATADAARPARAALRRRALPPGAALLAADLEAASQDDMTTRLLDEAPHQALVTVAQITRVLDLIAEGLPPGLVADGSMRCARSSRRSACTR